MKPPTLFFKSGPQAALEIAIRLDDVSAMGRAFDRGASPNAAGLSRATPLMIAVDAQSPRAVSTLLKAGAGANAIAVDRNGPVSLAVKSYRAQPHGREILMAVIRAGGNPNSRQPDGDPVLMQFIHNRDVEGLELMKALGASMDITDRRGDPLITNLALAQDWAMVWALIGLGAIYDYEHGRSAQPLSKALRLRYPGPASPNDAFKRRVWELLKESGLPVAPMER